MKKLVCLLLALVLTLALACTASAEWKFERKIDIVCPWGVGGGADGTIRPMANLLSDILGVPVEVVNVEGAGGVNGVEYTYRQPADGYTFMLGTQSLYMQDMQGTTSMRFKDEFIPVDVLVHSINIIAASKKALANYGVTDWHELSEYVKANPYWVAVGMLTATGIDGASLAQAIEGMDLLEVPFTSGSEVSSMMVGGHVALCISGTDEISGLIESGDIVPILALCENRMSVFPDVECSGENNVNSFMGPWRAIFAKNGTPQEAIDALVAAVEEAKQTQTWKDYTHQAAYDERQVPAPGEELEAFCEKEYHDLRDYLAEQGVLVAERDYYAQ